MTASRSAFGARFGARPLDLAFVALWLVCTAAHAVGGPRADSVFGLLEALVIAALYAITRRLTGRAAEPLQPPPRAPIAGIVVGAVIVLPALAVMGFSLAGHELDMSAWFAFVTRVAALLQRVLPFVDRDSLANFAAYALVPGVVLLVLGWRARDFGLGRSRRGTFRTLALWSVLPLLVYGVMAFAMGHGKPAALLHRWMIDLFRNGFAEEILWRGMALRLLIAPLGVSGANVAQAIGFGLLHLPADLREPHAVLWNALAECIATQGFNGYVMGLLRLRTGNVLVPGVFHALIDGGVVFA